MLDVSDVLASPEFLDTLSFVATVRGIWEADGKGHDTVSPSQAFSAVVAPVALKLIQQSDGALKDGAIEIFTQTRLSGGVKIDDANERLPDIVTWHGRQYVVASVEDWTSWGLGYQRVLSNLQQINPPA